MPTTQVAPDSYTRGFKPFCSMGEETDNEVRYVRVKLPNSEFVCEQTLRRQDGLQKSSLAKTGILVRLERNPLVGHETYE